MGGKGSGKQPKGKRTVKNVEPVLAPQGTGTKRTPVSAFDPAKDQDVYEPEIIVAERLKRGVKQYV